MKIGLVLSGGGMRGVAHIGAIKALEEHNIIPTHVAGTSSGAIVGGLYAYGYHWEDIFEFFKSTQLLDFKKYALHKPGFIDAEKFYPNFKSYIKEDHFSVLQKKLMITATNILDGSPTIFSHGELIKPMLASAAIPGVFAPVKIQDCYYVDGGTLNNFPVHDLKPFCDVIIGVYVNDFNEIIISELKNSYHVALRAFKIKSMQEDSAKFTDCDLLIHPKNLIKYGTFDKKHLDDVFNLGYEATNEKLKTNRFFKSKIIS
jgi:NTE family protein